MDELQAKHRKELRDLQSRITQKKKQASKKTRKGVHDECEALEAELRARQQEELAALDGGGGDGEVVSERLDELTLEVDGDEKEETTSNGPQQQPDTVSTATVPEPNVKKPNRQKARLAKRAAEQEEVTRQADAEAQNLPNLKQQERTRMLEQMRTHGLQEKEIRADGHCLYSAVADQLEQLAIPLGAAASSDKPTHAYLVVRAAAAEYIQAHADEFEPFLEEPLSEYLRKIRETGEWGGQLELQALARRYGVDVHVLRDFGRVEEIAAGEGKMADGKVVWLGYYKYGFGLGEHYNSLRKKGG